MSDIYHRGTRKALDVAEDGLGEVIRFLDKDYQDDWKHLVSEVELLLTEYSEKLEDLDKLQERVEELEEEVSDLTEENKELQEQLEESE